MCDRAKSYCKYEGEKMIVIDVEGLRQDLEKLYKNKKPRERKVRIEFALQIAKDINSQPEIIRRDAFRLYHKLLDEKDMSYFFAMLQLIGWEKSENRLYADYKR